LIEDGKNEENFHPIDRYHRQLFAKTSNPLIYYVYRATKPNLQLICCPIGRPKTEVGVRSSNLNLATLWLNCVRFTSLNCLKFSGSKQPVSAYHDIRQLAKNTNKYNYHTTKWFTSHRSRAKLVFPKEKKERRVQQRLYMNKKIHAYISSTQVIQVSYSLQNMVFKECEECWLCLAFTAWRMLYTFMKVI